MTGLLSLAASNYWWAGGLGAALAWLALAAGRRLSLWLHAVGLRTHPPAPASWALGSAALFGLLCAAVAQLPGPELRQGALAAAWGFAALDLANTARGAATLRQVVAGELELAAWQQLPLRLRVGLTAAAGPGYVVLLCLAALLLPSAGSLGFALGGLLHLSWQQRVASVAIDGRLRELAEQMAPPSEEA
ncbi:MAG: hypothetical protein IT204_10555 [Fimbriimonadaceae bacterium]|nr:hypothetical protein [Fimbriimonadaceae bacterium]